MTTTFSKLLLLLWKNFILQKRHPIQTVIEILVPVILFIFLVVIRSLALPVPRPASLYTPFPIDRFQLIGLDYNNQTEIWALTWNKPIYENIMREVVENINAVNNIKTNFTLKSLSNNADLEKWLKDPLKRNKIFAAVEFEQVYNSENTNINIRFPSESGSCSFWPTNNLYPMFQQAGPREIWSNEGNCPGYHKAFLPLQKEISLSYIKHLNPEFDRSSLNISMQRFAYSKWIEDDLINVLGNFFGSFIMLSFVYTCISTVKVITTEKEKQLKEAMKIMGLPSWLHWTAWFIKSFVLLLITVILITILLKVKWYPGTDYSIFTYTDGTLLFIFLLVFICSVITYCFAVSVLFSKANTAATVGGLIWFLSFSPFTFINMSYDTSTLAQILSASLLSNTAVAFGFRTMLTFENLQEGIQWNNIFKNPSVDEELTFGHSLIMLIIDTILYLVFALYIEAIYPGNYGVPQPFYFPFTKSYWCGNSIEHLDKHEMRIENENYETEPLDLQVGIQIRDLSKTFSKNKTAVDEVSMNIYEDQITVLLGHNGAGKTTTMSMLSGMIPPTSGTAYINGRDIRTDMVKIRDSYGLCPQHNILFDDLTVKEHIYFYCKLKGLSSEEVAAEIQKYIQLLQFETKANSLSSTLSGGMKRKLSVAIALCGHSKVVMCDEPSAGIDPGARRALWDLLLSQKKGRVILLTTHFMDEADLLGDRIAIMSEGKLQCFGSSFFLKKKYGAGYKLIMDVSELCVVENITNLLSQYIPNIQVKSKIGSELTYLLSENFVNLFESMLENLEKRSAELGVYSYGISLTTLEEVFMKVGDIQRGNKNYDEKTRTNDNRDNVEKLDYSVKIETQFLVGCSLWWNQFFAMIMKKTLSAWRSWILLITENLIPIGILIITVLIVRNSSKLQDLPSLKISLASYSKPITVLTSENNSLYKNSYIGLLQQHNHLLTDWNNNSMNEKMIEVTAREGSATRTKYIVGASFIQTNATAWFNNDPYHSQPVSLQLLLNSILLAQSTEKGPELQFYNYPLPYSLKTLQERINSNNNMGFQIGFNLGFAMAFVSAFYTFFVIKERSSKAKHLQIVSGIKVLVFWSAAFICDFLFFILTTLLIIITLAILQEDGFKTGEELGRLFSVHVVFGLSMLPLMYLASFLFDVPSTGFTKMAFINIFTGVGLMLMVQIIKALDLEAVGDALDKLFLLLPHYSYSTAVVSLYKVYLNNRLNVSNQNNLQDIYYYAWKKPGIASNLIVGCASGIIFTIILLLKEYGLFDRIAGSVINRNTPINSEPQGDLDVLTEKEKISKFTSEDIKKYAVVMKNVSKYYGNLLAVSNLNLAINRFECFGLLGINGAGKTTTFKLMTGDIKFFNGDAWINGLNLKKELNKINKFIGYCPQFDALLDDLTCKETLVIFGLIRGLNFQESKIEAQKLAIDFDFIQHINKKVKELSGGNKRKLSTALALIGDPLVIYLDEPTTGMDPATKRFLWNTLCTIRDSGKCIVLTSHSMEECEALCTKLAIMVNGSFKCLGSTQHLKSKYSDGFLLTVKLRKNDEIHQENLTYLENVKRFVNETFSNVIIREEYEDLIAFSINDKTKQWSKMFGIMEQARIQLNIEDYFLAQSSLEQIFLSFAKNQRVSDVVK